MDDPVTKQEKGKPETPRPAEILRRVAVALEKRGGPHGKTYKTVAGSLVALAARLDDIEED